MTLGAILWHFWIYFCTLGWIKCIRGASFYFSPFCLATLAGFSHRRSHIMQLKNADSYNYVKIWQMFGFQLRYSNKSFRTHLILIWICKLASNCILFRYSCCFETKLKWLVLGERSCEKLKQFWGFHHEVVIINNLVHCVCTECPMSEVNSLRTEYQLLSCLFLPFNTLGVSQIFTTFQNLIKKVISDNWM
jgi:hypothetical protein